MANKRKEDGGGVGPHVRALRGQRTDFDPAVLRTVMQFLFMLNVRYRDAEMKAAGRHDDTNGTIKAGIRKRFGQLADAAMVFAEDAACPWSRFAWNRAGDMLEGYLQSAAVANELPGTHPTSPPV